jgi:hypothetical protein
MQCWPGKMSWKGRPRAVWLLIIKPASRTIGHMSLKSLVHPMEQPGLTRILA